MGINARRKQGGKLDDVDLSIIACLQYDGRMPYTRIADELGVSEATVRNRVNRLRDEGVLQVVGVVDPHLLGMRSTAIVGVVAEPARIQHVAREIAGYDEVAYMVMTSGTFDLLVEILCEDTDHLARLLSDRLHTVEGVRRTETFYILRNYKLSYRWGLVPDLPARP